MSLGVKPRPMGTFDSELEFKDSAAVTSSAAAQVDSAAKVVDVGTALFQGKMIIDVSAMEVGTDEYYRIIVQGSTVAAFATATSIVDLAELHLGHEDTKLTDSDKADDVGRYKIYFDNENNGAYYRYLRVYTYVCSGTAETITYTAYCVPM